MNIRPVRTAPPQSPRLTAAPAPQRARTDSASPPDNAFEGTAGTSPGLPTASSTPVAGRTSPAAARALALRKPQPVPAFEAARSLFDLRTVTLENGKSVEVAVEHDIDDAEVDAQVALLNQVNAVVGDDLQPPEDMKLVVRQLAAPMLAPPRTLILGLHNADVNSPRFVAKEPDLNKRFDVYVNNVVPMPLPEKLWPLADKYAGLPRAQRTVLEDLGLFMPRPVAASIHEYAHALHFKALEERDDDIGDAARLWIQQLVCASAGHVVTAQGYDVMILENAEQQEPGTQTAKLAAAQAKLALSTQRLAALQQELDAATKTVANAQGKLAAVSHFTAHADVFADLIAVATTKDRRAIADVSFEGSAEVFRGRSFDRGAPKLAANDKDRVPHEYFQELRFALGDELEAIWAKAPAEQPAAVRRLLLATSEALADDGNELLASGTPPPAATYFDAAEVAARNQRVIDNVRARMAAQPSS